MKSLQNNFTTPEQSRRLLELGVPADSADCYIRLDFNITESPDIIRYYATFSEIKKSREIVSNNFIPCWSVGRLMEIYEICTGRQFDRINNECSVLDDILWQIEIHVTETAKGFSIDFSKLWEE